MLAPPTPPPHHYHLTSTTLPPPLGWVDMAFSPNYIYLCMGSRAPHKSKTLSLKKFFQKMHSRKSICIFTTFLCIFGKMYFTNANFLFLCIYLRASHKYKTVYLNKYPLKCISKVAFAFGSLFFFSLHAF